MYAVFEDGSRQFRVSEGDELEVDYREADPGHQIEFDRVLLYSGNEGVQVGRPTVPNAKIIAVVQEQGKGEKIYIQKFKRRKNYHRRQGHRQLQTRIQVKKIVAETTQSDS